MGNPPGRIYRLAHGRRRTAAGQALVRPPTTARRRTPGPGDRRRPGRLCQRGEPRRPWLAGLPAGAPRRPGPGSLGQPARRPLPQAVGPWHGAVTADSQRLRAYPALARTVAQGPRLGRLRRPATGLRRERGRTPGPAGRSLQSRVAPGPRSSPGPGPRRRGPRTRWTVLSGGRLGPSTGLVPMAGRAPEY